MFINEMERYKRTQKKEKPPYRLALDLVIGNVVMETGIPLSTFVSENEEGIQTMQPTVIIWNRTILDLIQEGARVYAGIGFGDNFDPNEFTVEPIVNAMRDRILHAHKKPLPGEIKKTPFFKDTIASTQNKPWSAQPHKGLNTFSKRNKRLCGRRTRRRLGHKYK